MGLKSILLILILLTACAKTGNVVLQEPMTESVTDQKLYVEPSTVKEQQKEFVTKLRAAGMDKTKWRPLYEEYIDVIGANGVLDGIETIYERCHGIAHDVGKIIFAKTKNIGNSLRICSNRCYTGCMHGVLMEAFAQAQGDEDHIEIEKLKPMIKDICFNDTEMKTSYGPGECAHGVGHAVMFLSGYIISEALRGCAEFEDKKMEYYCADGAYMEYVVERDEEDAKTRSMFYPCDTFDYPAACMRTKFGLAGKRLLDSGKTTNDLIKECEKLEGKLRLGCFHGLGTAYSKILALGKMTIKELCSHGTENEQIACIEGAAERIGKYFNDKTEMVCNELDDKKDLCFSAAERKPYSLDKDLTIYLT